MKNSICLYKISEILKQLCLNSLKFVLWYLYFLSFLVISQ